MESNRGSKKNGVMLEATQPGSQLWSCVVHARQDNTFFWNRHQFLVIYKYKNKSTVASVDTCEAIFDFAKIELMIV